MSISAMRDTEHGLVGSNASDLNLSGRGEAQLAPAPDRPTVFYQLEDACSSRSPLQEDDFYDNEHGSENETEDDNNTDEYELSSISSENGAGAVFQNAIDGPASVVLLQSLLPHRMARDSSTLLWMGNNHNDVLEPDSQDYQSLSVLEIVRRMPQSPLSFQEIVPGENNTNQRMQREFESIQEFVLGNSSIKWCSHPSCRYVNAVEFKDFEQLKRTHHNYSFEVVCSKGHRFCFSCGRSGHHPLRCKMLLDWELKMVQENTLIEQWFGSSSALSNLRPCPRSFNLCEREGHCRRIECRDCGYVFCFVCLGAWSEHRPPHLYTCNIFDEANPQKLPRPRDPGDPDASPFRLAMQANHLVWPTRLASYFFYLIRFLHHSQAFRDVGDKLDSINVYVGEMHENAEVLGVHKSVREVLIELQLSRRLLRWSYCLLYYEPESGEGSDPTQALPLSVCRLSTAQQLRTRIVAQQGSLESALDCMQESVDSLSAEQMIREHLLSRGGNAEMSLRLSMRSMHIVRQMRCALEATAAQFQRQIDIDLKAGTTSTTTTTTTA